MKKSTIKTVIINTLRTRDKINGNSYFSSEVIVNFGMKNEKTFYLPYQYGYGNAPYHETLKALNLLDLNDRILIKGIRFIEHDVKVSRKIAKLLNSEPYLDFNRCLDETKY